MPVAGEHHPAFEEYCECIFELHEDDVDVIQARIAERLQVSRPAVSEMMKRLEAEGLITSEHGIRLTDDGRRLGERVVRRHRLAGVTRVATATTEQLERRLRYAESWLRRLQR